MASPTADHSPILSAVVVGHCTAINRSNRPITLYNVRVETGISSGDNSSSSGSSSSNDDDGAGPLDEHTHRHTGTHTHTIRKLLSDFVALRQQLIDRYLVPIVPRQPSTMLPSLSSSKSDDKNKDKAKTAGAGTVAGNAATTAMKSIQSFTSEMQGCLTSWLGQLLSTDDVCDTPEVAAFCATSTTSDLTLINPSPFNTFRGAGASDGGGGGGNDDAAASADTFDNVIGADQVTATSKVPLTPTMTNPISVASAAAAAAGGAVDMRGAPASSTSSYSSSTTSSSISGKGVDSSSTSQTSSPSSSSSSAQPAHKATRLQDFLLLKVIGKGSFGKVMLVRKADTGDIYAMKVLSKASVVHRHQVEHTKTERNVLEYIHHPFIVRMRYAFQTATKLYFILDYCPGGELFFHLGRAGRFSEHRARFYAAEIVLAMEYLHDLGIVYRDLKPENVLLDGHGHVAITDFGLSKEGIADNVSAHSFCGTPEYLAPEILARTGHGRAADWWSLGALLYEMLTGMPPFFSRNRDRLFHKILKSELKIPRFFSPEAKSLLTQLLNRNHEQRLGSRDDALELKTHPFFASIDWEALLTRRVAPPFQPVIADVVDTGNFDAEFTQMSVHGDSVDRAADSALAGSAAASTSPGGRFSGFTYVPPHELPTEVALIASHTELDLSARLTSTQHSATTTTSSSTTTTVTQNETSPVDGGDDPSAAPS